VDGERIIGWSTHHNDSRINWDDTLPLGSPFEPDLHYWHGDEDPGVAVYDMMTMRSGVPVVGKGSLWPTKGRPVQSIMAVSDGPLKVPLSDAQAAAAKGTWIQAGEEDSVIQQTEVLSANAKAAVKLRHHHRGGAGAAVKPAVVSVRCLSGTDDEIFFYAFAQELMGDVVARLLRRNSRMLKYKLLFTASRASSKTSKGNDGKVVGMPAHLDGIPLDTSLAELGAGDGDTLGLLGVSPSESAWPPAESIQHPLQAFLSGRPWPPCSNFGAEEPLNRLPVGSRSQSAGGSPAENNEPSNLVVVALPDGRHICYNKHALANHLADDMSDPVSGLKVDRLFHSQVKAALMMDMPYMKIYLDESLYPPDSAAAH